jgi:hypothetical protein
MSIREWQADIRGRGDNRRWREPDATQRLAGGLDLNLLVTLGFAVVGLVASIWLGTSEAIELGGLW